MKIKLAILLLTLVLGLSANSAEIIYPKSDNVTINSPVTFFVGNENPDNELFINSEKVNIHPSGGFFQPVDLNIGENIFKITNGTDTKTYKITRKVIQNHPVVNTTQISYEQPNTYITKENNVPLRATPYDGGINRLQHLEKNIPLSIIGEFGSFYKVQLARDDYAWISKSHVIKTKENITPAEIASYTYDETPEKRIYTLKLNKKAPYILSETRSFLQKDNFTKLEPIVNGLDLVVYNVNGFPEDKFEFHINRTGKAFGYKTYYKNESELVIEVKNFPQINNPKPLEGLKITIDPGHGGNESGAIGCLGDKEKDVNLSISQKLKEKLENAGAKVAMTRIDDTAISLTKRVEISQNNKADVFISIHNNALPDSAAKSNRNGSSVYYFYPQSKELANRILDALTGELCMNNDKVRQESFAVIRNTESPAVLIELGYMINPEDNAKLIDCDFQEKAADAILHGLENYFNEVQ